MFNDIAQSYTGGIVDVYKPHLINGYYYDVVSLYPTAKYNNPMPVGEVTFTDDPNLDNYFGFVLARIKCDPAKVAFPFLSTKNKNRIVLHSPPCGGWSGWYFSEELKFARKHGYEVTVIVVINFLKENIYLMIILINSLKLKIKLLKMEINL